MAIPAMESEFTVEYTSRAEYVKDQSYKATEGYRVTWARFVWVDSKTTLLKVDYTNQPPRPWWKFW